MNSEVDSFFFHFIPSLPPSPGNSEQDFTVDLAFVFFFFFEIQV